jgi:ssDNA-binding Zn-finger/Zn-ribbon topoisomerase 1
MNLRWLTFDYVDPELPLSIEQRQRVRVRGLFGQYDSKRALLSKPANLIVALVPAFGMILGMGVFFLFFRGSSLFSWLGVAVAVGVQVAVTWFLLAILGKYTWRPIVAAELRTFGYDVCPKCGYWLRGLGEDVRQCPECGAAREALDKSTNQQVNKST